MMDSHDRSRTSSLATAGLRHPLFWAALALLAANDHVLKGAGLLPTVLTGKLSDFAGLIVAPLVLTALLGGRRRVAFAAVGGWFAAVNLSPALAAVSVDAMALLGVPWRLWADPTDLIALAVLPVTWHMTTRFSVPTQRYRVLERSALVLGVFACMATSNPDPVVLPPMPAPPPANGLSLFNTSIETVELRVRWLEGSLDCAAIDGHLSEALGRDAFGAGVTYRVDPEAYASLDRPEGSTTGSCTVAFLQSTAFEERILFWRPDGSVGSHLVRLVQSDGEFEVTDSSGYVTMGEPLEAAPVEACSWRDEGRSYGWSLLDRPLDFFELVSVEPTVDECLALTLAVLGAPEVRSSLFLCIPADDFIFLPGDILEIREVPLDGSARYLDLRRIPDPSDPLTVPVARMQILVDVSSISVAGLVGDFSSAAVCGGDRLACGGYRVSGAVEIWGDAGRTLLGPGNYVDFEVEPGFYARLRLGRAEQIIFTRPECGAGRDEVGTHLDAVWTYWEESE